MPPRLPTSRLGRVGELAALAARAGVRGLGHLGQGEAKTRAMAEAAAETLGKMRGLAMKVGQMASYVDGMIPVEHGEVFERVLAPLRAAAPSMTPEAAARRVREELGRPPTEIFAAWGAEPIAAASIGQVHRATLPDGREVAVKIQQVGIEQAVRADLGNATLLGGVVPFAGRMGVGEQLAERRDRFLEELDYRHEARRQQQFAAAFANDPRIAIPEVIAELSTRRVLTTTFAPGVAFDAAARAPVADRAAWIETLWRFVFESILVHGLFNADPHPGNYLFEPDGRVAFLDFGCTRALAPGTLAAVRRVHALATAGDRDGLCAAMLELTRLPREGVIGRVATEYISGCFAPILAPGPFHVTREFARSLVVGLQEKKLEVLRSAPAQLRAPPGELLFFNRLQIGFYSVLARLDVPFDYHALHARIVARMPR